MRPYKVVIVDELLPIDYGARQLACENILVALLRDAVIFFSGEMYFHTSVDLSIDKTCIIGV